MLVRTHLYLFHVELAHNKSLNNFRQERGMGIALVEAAKSLVFSNVKGHDKVSHWRPRLKSMVHGVYLRIVQCINAMQSANST